MNYFAFISFFEGIICISVGIYALARNSRAKLNQVFFLLCFVATWNAFTEFMYRLHETPEEAYSWSRLGFIWLTIPLLVHFTLIFIGQEKWLKKKGIYLWLYIPAVVFSICEAIPLVIIIDVKKEWWGWEPVYNNGPLDLLTLCWGMFLVLLCIGSLYKFQKKIGDKQKKSQGIMITIVLFCQLLIGGIPLFLDPLIPLTYPKMPVFWLSIGCLFIGYAMNKYELFKIPPMNALMSAMMTMREAFLFTDIQGKILGANPSTESLLRSSISELKDKSFAQIFENGILLIPELKDEKLTQILNSDIITNLDVQIPLRNANEKHFSLSKSQYFNNNGFLQGYVYILLEIPALKEFE